jgi:peptide/nickel transport system permease protein
MLTYILKRLLGTIPVFAVVTVFVFLLLHLTPGDPAVIIGGDYATPEQIAAIRTQLGLDRPLFEQFMTWLTRLSKGDLGVSIFSAKPVSELIVQRLEPTLILALATITLSIVVAIPLGIIAATQAGRMTDRCVMAFSVVGFSTPVFVVGYLLVFVFALKFRWFPTQGYVPLAKGLWPCLHSLALPTLTLALLYVALIARVTRATVMEVLAEDYIRTAEAKGLGAVTILLCHTLKNAAVPIVTVVGIGIAALLGGVVVTETVFNIPGLGRLTSDAILRHDYPVVQGLIFVFALTYVGINLLVDLSYVLFDPRIRY